jgi:SulP family sulfate permease
MAVAAPLAGYIPLSALAGILVVVAWNMVEKSAFRSLLANSRGDATVLLATFLLVIFVDLPTGITVGVVLGCLVFMHRMAQAIDIQTHHHADVNPDAEYVTAPGIIIHRISGAFFFGAASAVLTTLERINEVPKAYILDFALRGFLCGAWFARISAKGGKAGRARLRDGNHASGKARTHPQWHQRAGCALWQNSRGQHCGHQKRP